MKKILIVISSLRHGGAERAVSNLTLNFPADWEIDILLNNDEVIDYPYRGTLLSLGFNRDNDMASLMFHLKLLFRRTKALRKLKKTGQYAACISFMDSANVANILSGNRHTKVIGSVRTSIRKFGKTLWEYRLAMYPLVRCLYNRADAIVAVSSGIKEELVREFGMKADQVVVIENGCNVSALTRKAAEALEGKDAELEDKKLIVTAGRLSEPKGQWHLIRAFREVSRREPEAMLLILGAGELEEYLKRLVKVCGLQDRVVFQGFVKNPYKYVARAEMFVLPSLFEGYPNALAEAVCLGVTCIATDFHAGAREILAPELVENGREITEVCRAEYGVLTPVCSGTRYQGAEELEEAECKLAEAICMLLEDADQREYYARQSLKRRKMLSIDTAVEKWLKLCENKVY